MTTKSRPLSDLEYPPGELLAEELEARDMTQKDLARQMNRPAQLVSEIIRAKKAITAETALDLENVLGISAHFWLALEADYRITLERNRRLRNKRPREANRKPGLQVADDETSAAYGGGIRR